MGIIYKVDQEDLGELLKGRIDPETPLVEQVQVIVSCMGDIAVQPFYPEDCEGIAWCLLSAGPKGEPGRDIRGEVDEGPRYLQSQPGVLIGATDPRSLDTIITVLDALRRRLRGQPPMSLEAELSRDMAMVVDRDIEEQETAALMEATEDVVGQHIHEASKGIQDEAGREAYRAMEEALRPDQPLGQAVGTAISEDLDQAMIDALYEDEPDTEPRAGALRHEVTDAMDQAAKDRQEKPE